ncbi:hypothetical protein [Microbacterium maritypicum]|uniref:Uncharacterized protein n=2 Tax=Microbacterium maritypicum TaxID=33918 RepID=A0ACD4B906_MICMQ|nr:hypothetical protein [Microbacterium liquefaciens]UTT53789.1 hypothetical protein NMQ05_04200 [Microbacterium liquefaciens]UTT53855.1 hypothetical protein NMQ05_04535 [Microbacterium liquefaciens]
MTDQKLVDELEKALRDEAYDGGFGYMGDEQFTAYVRTLAETAAEVVEKALTPTDDERRILGDIWDDGNAVGLDGWVGPGRGTEPIDDHAVYKREIAIEKYANALRRSEVPEPSEMVVKVASALIEADYPGEGDVLFRNHAMLPYVERAEVVAAALRGEPAPVPTTKGWKLQPVSELPEPSAEVLSDWFTSSRGVAVAAVKPMTDRGPSVMVDGRVISPNDVAALIEFKAQCELSDAHFALINAAESMTPDEIHQHPMAALDKLRALAREMRVTGGIQSKPSEEQREAAMDAAWGVRAQTRPTGERRNAEHWFNFGWRAALRAAGGVR